MSGFISKIEAFSFGNKVMDASGTIKVIVSEFTIFSLSLSVRVEAEGDKVTFNHFLTFFNLFEVRFEVLVDSDFVNRCSEEILKDDIRHFDSFSRVIIRNVVLLIYFFKNFDVGIDIRNHHFFFFLSTHFCDNFKYILFDI